MPANGRGLLAPKTALPGAAQGDGEGRVGERGRSDGSLKGERGRDMGLKGASGCESGPAPSMRAKLHRKGWQTSTMVEVVRAERRRGAGQP
jgi:hypothetical protein